MLREMEAGRLKMEAFLRLCAMLLSILTACLVGLDTQTKLLFYSVLRKATFKDLNVFFVLVQVESVVAGYNLLQLSRCFVSARFKGSLNGSYIYLAWVCFLLDQVAVYVTFATNSAALQASLLAITGERGFQWMKLCNRYTRFCTQIGGALVCSFIASLVMAAISSMSAFNLFRLYSPMKFLALKSH